ncbi:GTPase ObgE [Desulfobacter hydrogenophilus]|uniref:GTPase Obg n=1 Tax=Desulfobacter hydrogenophilus TaxID=2291 RepID=A0A328FGM3_9BACT|nr:GTPase ObgE [Desulfobacter hydrogenophilus]NDY72179.1 GTPase ObgE [Desulfobacter hydrogenophilus]QBH15139.1 GTPase ObgE [Desulfobacter hydrogenophilus]RAM02187.1 GTPase ObgE [Desulfobacter hydrogenophilus]
MKFVDEAIVTIRSGSGGAGCVSFRRERFIEKGGPDGGDGGDGGDVILRVDPSKRTLYEYRRQKRLSAKNGASGLGRQKHGKNGSHCILTLPPGTIVFDAQTSQVIADLTDPDKEIVVAQGGMGGRGNKRFASSTNRVPRFAQPGIPGVEMKLRLELKLMADVGLVGLPNAGKSTLISAMSAARPKIADYPFTTLNPTIGMVEAPFGEPFAVADIPGLIEGAHEGVGLGIKFLKHIERTGILVHLIDSGDIDPENPLAQFQLINNELSMHSDTLANKTQVVVLNKLDLTGTKNRVEAFKDALPDQTIFTISAATGEGVKPLIKHLAQLLQALAPEDK